LALGLVVSGLAALSFGQPAPGAAQEVTERMLERSVARVGHGLELKGNCSGVFIAPDRVLTAGHCAGGKKWSFDPSSRLNVGLGEDVFPVTDVRLAPTSPFGSGGEISDLGHDWALLSVRLPEGASITPITYVGPEAARLAFATDEPLVKAGFSPVATGDRMLQATDDCLAVGLQQDLRTFLFRCPEGLGAGLSGSVLIGRSNIGLVVLGVQSGKIERRETGEALGVAVVAPREAIAQRD
jgi:hypothetical protein